MKTAAIIVVLFVVIATIAAEKAPTVGAAKSQDGVFMLANPFSSTVLELKGGRFRYWFASDVPLDKEPEYPLSGDYLINGDTITLDHTNIYERTWTFRSLDGIPTLWRPTAIKDFAEGNGLDPWGILRPTSRSGDDAWRLRCSPLASEDRQKSRAAAPFRTYMICFCFLAVSGGLFFFRRALQTGRNIP